MVSVKGIKDIVSTVRGSGDDKESDMVFDKCGLSNVFEITDYTDDKYHLPREALAMYGCGNCEWKGTEHCPHKVTESGEVQFFEVDPVTGKDIPVNMDMYSGMCRKRKSYLLMLTGVWDKMPSFVQWQNRLQRARAELVNNRDFQRYLMVQSEYDKLLKELRDKELMLSGDGDGVSYSDPGQLEDEIKRLRELIKSKRADVKVARDDWLVLWDKVGARIEKQVDRETVKKVEMDVTKHTIPHNQMLKIMRGEPVDAEFKEVKENESDKQ